MRGTMTTYRLSLKIPYIGAIYILTYKKYHSAPLKVSIIVSNNTLKFYILS